MEQLLIFSGLWGFSVWGFLFVCLGFWFLFGFFFSNFRLNSISTLEDVFPSFHCQDMLTGTALPPYLDADAPRLLLPTASLCSHSYPSAHQPWVNWVAFKSSGSWCLCLDTARAQSRPVTSLKHFPCAGLKVSAKARTGPASRQVTDGLYESLSLPNGKEKGNKGKGLLGWKRKLKLI